VVIVKLAEGGLYFADAAEVYGSVASTYFRLFCGVDDFVFHQEKRQSLLKASEK